MRSVISCMAAITLVGVSLPAAADDLGYVDNVPGGVSPTNPISPVSSSFSALSPACSYTFNWNGSRSQLIGARNYVAVEATAEAEAYSSFGGGQLLATARVDTWTKNRSRTAVRLTGVLHKSYVPQGGYSVYLNVNGQNVAAPGSMFPGLDPLASGYDDVRLLSDVHFNFLETDRVDIPVLFFVIGVKVKLDGQVGYQLNFTNDSSDNSANFNFEPFVQTWGTGEVSLSAVGAEIGAAVALNLLNASLPVGAKVSVPSDPFTNPSSWRLDADLALSGGGGNIGGWVRTPPILFFPARRYDFRILTWPSIGTRIPLANIGYNTQTCPL